MAGNHQKLGRGTGEVFPTAFGSRTALQTPLSQSSRCHKHKPVNFFISYHANFWYFITALLGNLYTTFVELLRIKKMLSSGTDKPQTFSSFLIEVLDHIVIVYCSFPRILAAVLSMVIQ